MECLLGALLWDFPTSLKFEMRICAFRVVPSAPRFRCLYYAHSLSTSTSACNSGNSFYQHCPRSIMKELCLVWEGAYQRNYQHFLGNKSWAARLDELSIWVLCGKNDATKAEWSSTNHSSHLFSFSEDFCVSLTSSSILFWKGLFPGLQFTLLCPSWRGGSLWCKFRC